MSNEGIIKAINAGGNRQQLMLELWQQNQGLVVRIARRFRGVDEWEDIMQAAYIGLDTAARHYDPAAGVLFVTYAGYWIRQAVQRQTDDSAGMIRLPSGQRQKLLAYKWDVETLTALLKHMPTPGDIADYTGLSLEQIAELEAAAGMDQLQSLDAPIETDNGDSVTLSDVIEDTRDAFGETDEEIYQAQFKADLWGIVDALPDCQPDIIKARYIDGKTAEQAAEKAGITRQEGRKQEERAMRALRRGKARRQLLPYWEEIAGAAMKGVGSERFSQTWTSATEREALRLY